MLSKPSKILEEKFSTRSQVQSELQAQKLSSAFKQLQVTGTRFSAQSFCRILKQTRDVVACTSTAGRRRAGVFANIYTYLAVFVNISSDVMWVEYILYNNASKNQDRRMQLRQ